MAELTVINENSFDLRSLYGDVLGSLGTIKKRLEASGDEVIKCNIYGSSKHPFIDMNLLLCFDEIGHLSVSTLPHLNLREMSESEEFNIVHVVDLSPLQHFSKLVFLSLRYCVKNLEGIEHCTNLRQLRLTDLPVSDLSPLSSLSLTHLHLSNVHYDSLVMIKDLRSLTVSLSRRSIDALRVAESFPNLEKLHFELRPDEKELADYNVNGRRKYQGITVGYRFCCAYLEYLGCAEDLREIIDTISGLEELQVTWNLHGMYGDLRTALSYCQA